jgi:hypothetical protein
MRKMNFLRLSSSKVPERGDSKIFSADCPDPFTYSEWENREPLH